MRVRMALTAAAGGRSGAAALSRSRTTRHLLTVTLPETVFVGPSFSGPYV
jgi:hypothetical protein